MKHGGLLMKISLFKLVFLKKTDICVPLPQRFQKTFAHKSKHQKKSKYICRQLK